MSLREQIRIMVVDDMATSRGLIINAQSGSEFGAGQKCRSKLQID